MPPLPAVVLERWAHASGGGGTAIVLPDGCRDLILRREAGCRPQWLVSPLDTQARSVASARATQWLGFRLRPGTRIDSAALLAAARHVPEGDESALLPHIDQHAVLDPRVADALAALREAPQVAWAARALGVSPRSLERLLHSATGQPPQYWRALARVRGAAQALASGAPLAAIAASHGYADQAHFSRECLRWLGATPARLRAAPALLALACAPGYGAGG